MWPDLQIPADLVTFIEEILNGKLQFLCSDIQNYQIRAQLQPQYGQYFPSFSYIADLLCEPLGKWGNSKIWEMSINVVWDKHAITSLSLTYKISTIYFLIYQGIKNE